MELKACSQCWKSKPLSEFYETIKRGKPYVRANCKDCERNNSKARAASFRLTDEYHSEERRIKRNQAAKEYHKKHKDEINQKARIKNINKYYDIRHRLMCLWQAMKRRCYNPQCDKYRYYWGKWVVIERESFDEFYADMEASYKKHVEEFWYWRKNTQIDRIDPDWNYSKDNCRRVTAKENNHRNHDKNFML